MVQEATGSAIAAHEALLPIASPQPAPAARAAGPNAANTTAPIIDPSPITTASMVASRGDNAGLGWVRCLDRRIATSS